MPVTRPLRKPIHLMTIGALFICAGFWLPGAAISADAPGTPKDSPSRAEQSSEEAAGGKMNLTQIRKFCDEDIKKLCRAAGAFSNACMGINRV